MEKIKLTQEQADAIESLRSGGYDDDVIVRNTLFYEMGTNENPCKRYNSLLDLHTDKLIRALYIGYEVESEFKVGDWVYVETPKSELPNVYKIMLVNKYHAQLDRLYGNHDKSKLRHATPEEIEKEKQRRWWKSHNREVRELRKGDIIVGEYDGYHTVWEITDEGYVIYSHENRNTQRIKRKEIAFFKVVCFAEDRKDIKT